MISPIPKAKPPFLVKPKPFSTKIRHSPKKVPMSLISVLSGRSGLVLCSDSQETVSNYQKKSLDKITVWNFSNRPFRIALASACDDGDYADMLASELASCLFELREFHPHVVTNTLEKALLEFYPKHIWPQPNPPTLGFLVALQPIPDGYPIAWHVSKSALHH